MALQECQQKTTSTEFLEWQIKRQKDVNGFHREDYFYAQIAHMIAHVNSTKDVPFDPFLLKFKTGETKKIITHDERAAKIKHSQRAWAMLVGARDPNREDSDDKEM